MNSLTPEVREQLLKFKVGTIVESQTGEYIGYVVGYHMRQVKGYWVNNLPKVQWIYQLRVQWVSMECNDNSYKEDEDILDFNDVKIVQ
jgi:hypothetical protein